VTIWIPWTSSLVSGQACGCDIWLLLFLPWPQISATGCLWFCVLTLISAQGSMTKWQWLQCRAPSLKRQEMMGE
jgi:hypothetical protein